MFERLCALLLRLYPAEFRRAYGDEAAQLIRDRVEHERSVFLRGRLLIDLAIDLGATSLRGWQRRQPALAPVDGAPRFDTIDIHRPRLEALAVGMLTSILTFAAFTLLLQPRPLPSVALQQQAAAAAADARHQHAFASISIQLSRSHDPYAMRMRVLANGDFNATAVPLILLVSYAYDVPANGSLRLVGLPGWRERYDISAKAPANAIPADLSEHHKRSRVQAMLRGLLADRFKLVMRVEPKKMPAYALTVARGGPRLQKSSIADTACVFDTATPDSCHHFFPGRGHPLNGKAITMDDLAGYIENWTDLPVVNRTAVYGLFAVETGGWMPMRLPPPPPGAAPTSFDDLPTLFTVLRTLGLELKREDAIVPVYTMEHIERPAGA